MNNPRKKLKNPKDSLRMRVIAAKEKFPKGVDYTPLYIYEFGPQTKKSLDLIRMVWNLRDTDADITSNLEKIAKNISA